MNRRILTEALIVGSLLAFCGFLFIGRVAWLGTVGYSFLVKNLFLASIPFFLSGAMLRCQRKSLLFALGCLWLAFFPNAPYLLTDLIHLSSHRHRGAPQWYDLMMLLTACGAGLALAFFSLNHVQIIVGRLINGVCGWIFAIAVLFVSSFGIYLGRFLRWNSWDVLQSPVALFSDIFARLVVPWDYPRTWTVTLGFGTMLSIGYAAALYLRAPHAAPALDTEPSRLRS
jgi:uncharacterized membrane protein